MEMGELHKNLQILEHLEDWYHMDSEFSEDEGHQGSIPIRNKTEKTKPISLSPVAVTSSDGTNLITTWSPPAQTMQPQSGDVSSFHSKQPVQNSENVTETPSSPTFGTSDAKMNTKFGSRLEATFTHTNEVQETGIKSGRGYRALAGDFTSTTSTAATFSDKRLTSSTDQLVVDDEEENLVEAMLVFTLSVFGPLWTLGMSYWNFLKESYSQALLPVVVLSISLLVTTLVYILPRNSPRREIWKRNKFIWLLCIIPGLPSIILSFCNIIFCIRESGSRSYERPWRGTRSIFLAESLTLAFMQCVLHLVILVEDPPSIHTYQGYASVTGIAIFSFSITLARFRYDTQHKIDRFGVSFAKWLRFICLWANKCLWITTFTMTILCFRLGFPFHATGPIVAGIGLMFIVHEVPIVLMVCPPLERMAQNCVGGLMLIPQAIALTSLLFWINLNPDLYSSDTASMLLGIFFWSELFILTGWLYDRCTGREIDFIPFYPHFLGDIWN